jgi:hypothetical protein
VRSKGERASRRRRPALNRGSPTFSGFSTKGQGQGAMGEARSTTRHPTQDPRPGEAPDWPGGGQQAKAAIRIAPLPGLTGLLGCALRCPLSWNWNNLPCVSRLSAAASRPACQPQQPGLLHTSHFTGPPSHTSHPHRAPSPSPSPSPSISHAPPASCQQGWRSSGGGGLVSETAPRRR